MKWFQDEPNDEFRDRVLQAAETELLKNRKPNTRRFWLWQMAGAAGVAAVAAVLVKPQDHSEQEKAQALALNGLDPRC